MVQKVTEVVGTLLWLFAKATDNAVMSAAKTIRHLKWFRVLEFEGQFRDLEGQRLQSDGQDILRYRVSRLHWHLALDPLARARERGAPANMPVNHVCYSPVRIEQGT